MATAGICAALALGTLAGCSSTTQSVAEPSKAAAANESAPAEGTSNAAPQMGQVTVTNKTATSALANITVNTGGEQTALKLTYGRLGDTPDTYTAYAAGAWGSSTIPVPLNVLWAGSAYSITVTASNSAGSSTSSPAYFGTLNNVVGPDNGIAVGQACVITKADWPVDPKHNGYYCQVPDSGNANGFGAVNHNAKVTFKISQPQKNCDLEFRGLHGYDDWEKLTSRSLTVGLGAGHWMDTLEVACDPGTYPDVLALTITKIS